MLRRFIYPGDISASGGPKILHGNDTDVSLLTIVQVHKDKYVCTEIMTDEDTGEAFPSVYMRNFEELKKDFEVQDGAPMMYMSKADFDWLTE